MLLTTTSALRTRALAAISAGAAFLVAALVVSTGATEVGGDRCAPALPLVTATPSCGGPVDAHTTVVYQVSVTNQDAGPCAPRGFFLQVDAPSATVATFVQPGIVVPAPGGAARFLVAITADTNAAPGSYAIPFRVQDIAAAEPITGTLTYQLRPPPTCFTRPDRELFARDLSVVEDPVRTNAGADARRATWSFGHLARRFAADPSRAAARVRAFFETWLATQTVNGEVVAARPAVAPFLLDPWPKLSDGSLDLDRAPLRLLAIVNRIDLRSVAKHDAGEARFIFNVLRSNGDPTPFNLILEYTIPARRESEVLEWAKRWHELGALPFPGERYNAALERITERIVTSTPAGGTLSSLRTNDFSLAPLWELRQFGLGKDGALIEQPVDLTPETTFLTDNPVLADFVNRDEDAILRGVLDVPLRFEGAPFRGGSSINLLQPWRATGIHSLAARQIFSLNTCNGCHSSPETGTNFLHVEPRALGAVSTLSGFLRGIALADPLSGEVRTFNDLGRRKHDLESLVCPGDSQIDHDVAHRL